MIYKREVIALNVIRTEDYTIMLVFKTSLSIN